VALILGLTLTVTLTLQVALIRQLLDRESLGRPNGGKLVEVSTIDAFQGRERSFIIFSAVCVELISLFTADSSPRFGPGG
jgi:hypothetical protein